MIPAQLCPPAADANKARSVSSTQRMPKGAEQPPWARLLPATSDTPAVALYYDSEYVRAMDWRLRVNFKCDFQV